MYGSQIWEIKEESFQMPKKNLAPLNLLQNNCLRRIIGGYKRYPRAVLNRETAIARLNLYIKMTVFQRAVKVANNPVKGDIKGVINNI